MTRRENHNLAIAAVGAWWLFNVVIPAKAFQYGCAAEHDERNGLPCTAAMRWRNAAELLAANPPFADYFWRQWERVMRLPRRLAGPIGASSSATPLSPVSARQTRTDRARTFEAQRAGTRGPRQS
jgi:hypothetical protein